MKTAFKEETAQNTGCPGGWGVAGGVCPYLVVLFLGFKIGLETQVPLRCSFSSVDK